MLRSHIVPRSVISAAALAVLACVIPACDSGPRPMETSRPAPKADTPADTPRTHAKPDEGTAVLQPATPTPPPRDPAKPPNEQAPAQPAAPPAPPPPAPGDSRAEYATSQPAAQSAPSATGPARDERPPDFLSIVERIDAGRGFRAKSEIKSPSRLVLTTENIRRLRIDLRKLPFDRKRSTALLIDGQGVELTGKHNVVELVRSRNGDWSPAQPVEAP